VKARDLIAVEKGTFEVRIERNLEKRHGWVYRVGLVGLAAERSR
jgi:hypothetical protein